MLRSLIDKTLVVDFHAYQVQDLRKGFIFGELPSHMKATQTSSAIGVRIPEVRGWFPLWLNPMPSQMKSKGEKTQTHMDGKISIFVRESLTPVDKST